MPIADTPEPPYYAVLFTTTYSETTDGYREMGEQMIKLAASQPGFLGMETVRKDIGILLSYWTDLGSIAAWRKVSAHRTAQRMGQRKWFNSYKIRICRVERDYGFNL